MGSIASTTERLKQLAIEAAAATQNIDRLTDALVKHAEAGQAASASWTAVTLNLQEYVKQSEIAKDKLGEYSDAVAAALAKMEGLAAFAKGSFAETFTRDITNKFKEGKLSVEEYRKALNEAILKMQELAASGGMGLQGMADLVGQQQEMERILAELERNMGR